MNPGSWAVMGPAQMTAEQGGSLTVSCSYEMGYELYSKYWCRQAFLSFCFTYIAQTNGSEVTVTQGRVSIRDNHSARSFMVTLSSVKLGDAGWYFCGVRKSLLFSPQHTTEVMVSTAVSTTTEGSNVSLLTTNRLCPTGCGDPPVPSQLSITYLLLFLSVKVPVALALACGAAWVRSRRRSRDRENLSEAAGRTKAPGCPPAPTTLEAQGCPPPPLPPTLPGLRHPSRPPHAGRCSDLGASLPVNLRSHLAAPVLERGGFGAQTARPC
ncbi:CMRF35-like molecule 5 isoform X1 [Aquila chrysaetos chrysaetos]|uniref:CMRF35-like molecule 5 isoform X1 n=2 Tax=Aquila chrysaetos chrysaetos TaxID=223781 RepID=UPI001B7D309A|nr:CMRF35-like molecule 5 isoform X1 [Aquila chrysaetos chrysaetos]XP_040979491.1 CMRF35-like molecule 5 isoform X1 [Aquila chrysaetos chrysaetos]